MTEHNANNLNFVFVLLSLTPDHLTSSMNTQNTYNATSSAKDNLNYAMQSTMEQLREQVERVCATNEKTETRLQSLVDRINKINVSLMSSCICVFHNIVYRLSQQK